MIHHNTRGHTNKQPTSNIMTLVVDAAARAIDATLGDGSSHKPPAQYQPVSTVRIDGASTTKFCEMHLFARVGFATRGIALQRMTLNVCHDHLTIFIQNGKSNAFKTEAEIKKVWVGLRAGIWVHG